MGMSTRVQAVIERDAHYDRMYAAYVACKTAGVEPPDEVTDFFNDEPPNPDGMTVDVAFNHSSDGESCSDYYDVDIENLPEGTTIIRFVNSF